MALAPKESRHIGLQHQLSRITRRALPWSVSGGALVALLGALRGIPLRDAVSSGVSVTVAAVPEGLPLVATLAQLSAARALTDRHVLIRNANSVEALARLDVVCFDKTGTLSENRLQVRKYSRWQAGPLQRCLGRFEHRPDPMTGEPTTPPTKRSGTRPRTPRPPWPETVRRLLSAASIYRSNPAARSPPRWPVTG